MCFNQNRKLLTSTILVFSVINFFIAEFVKTILEGFYQDI